MSSISVLPTSGLTVALPVKPGATTTVPASNEETAKSQPTTQGHASVLYPSPTESIDPATSQLVIEFRDGATGNAEYQTPSKAQLRLYEVNQSRVDVSGHTPTSPVPVPANNSKV
jgi:hypothetical protein